jgi:hypothetical protein
VGDHQEWLQLGRFRREEAQGVGWAAWEGMGPSQTHAEAGCKPGS